MYTLLLISSAILGFLAFFEPCSIATHTLFAYRMNNKSFRHKLTDIVLITLSRSILFVFLLAGLTLVTSKPDWGHFLPAMILTAMGLIYLISRFIYIPIPHLEFYKLIPGGRRFPFSIQLGLTLPACTIPLVIVIAGISIATDSPLFSAFAGLLFAILFNSPIFYLAATKVDDRVGYVLSIIAKITPFITSFLLVGTAIYLLLPTAETSMAALQSQSVKGVPAIIFTILIGFFFSFNPVALSSIPLVLAYVTKTDSRRQTVFQVGAFIAGLLLTHIVIGAIAGKSGQFAIKFMGARWGALLGAVLILLGTVWFGWIKIRIPGIGMRAWKIVGTGGAFLLSIPYSIAVCPFCTPLMMAIIVAIASIGSATYGMILMGSFALGRSIMMLIGVIAVDSIRTMNSWTRYPKVFQWIGGTAMIFVGLYLINGYYNLI